MHRSVPATGFTSCDHLHPGCTVIRPTWAPPARLSSSKRQLVPSRTSSGFSNDTCSKGWVLVTVAPPSRSAAETWHRPRRSPDGPLWSTDVDVVVITPESVNRQPPSRLTPRAVDRDCPGWIRGLWICECRPETRG